MNNHLRKLAQRYTVTLQRYLANEQEADLEEAYELGRHAIARGLGVLDVARSHQEALLGFLRQAASAENLERAMAAAKTFLLETLSPFEVTHRGFRETNVKLQQAIATLEKRNLELAATNCELHDEIGQRQRTEKALRESERRIATLIETAHDVIFSLTPDGCIAAVNPAFEVITGWPRKDWLGKPFAPLVHPDDMELAVKRFGDVMHGKPPKVWEYRVRKANGQYVVGEFSLARDIKDGKTAGIFGIGRDITERKQAAEAFRELSRRVLHAQEEERKRISRELHDEVGQSLTAISVTLATLKNNGVGHSKSSRQKLSDAQHLLRDTMETVHRFARELRPAMLDELGLLPALRSCLKAFAHRTGLCVHFRASPIAEMLSDDEKTVLFRVAQESLTNVARHAHASHVNCSIRNAKGGVCMEITDNGRSFRENPQGSGKRKKRLGLIGIQERVQLVNGHFTIKPQLGLGTTVRVLIPFKASGPALLSKRGLPQTTDPKRSRARPRPLASQPT